MSAAVSVFCEVAPGWLRTSIPKEDDPPPVSEDGSGGGGQRGGTNQGTYLRDKFSAATLGWTATWTDSNGNAQTPTNLSLVQSGTAAPALTFTTSAGNYYGDAIIDVNNAGANIVMKLTFSGTSFTAKVSATVERLQ